MRGYDRLQVVAISCGHELVAVRLETGLTPERGVAFAKLLEECSAKPTKFIDYPDLSLRKNGDFVAHVL